MAQYIDKSAIAAEIKKRIRMYSTVNACSKKSEERYRIKWHTLMSILSFIDTLEVKEVDLEKELDKWYNTEASKDFENVLYKDIEKCVEHFFNLGLKAQKGE